MVLFLHNRYRTTGGEERVVEKLLALVQERMGEQAELLTRDSSEVGAARAAAGLLRGGLGARDVAKAVRLTGAGVVHAHNLNPLFGWRALAAARAEGARVVLHLHQYRLVCANGVCFTGGRECTRCKGRNTLPGVIHNCRGSRAEALAYGASLALWQGHMAGQADAVIVPSVFARERLRELGAPLDWDRVHVLAPPIEGSPARASTPARGTFALVVSRLAPEKGVDVAIEACRLAGVPLVVAGDGPQMGALRARGAGNRGGLVKEPRAHAGHPETEHTHPSPPPEPTTPPSGENDPLQASTGGAVRFLGRVDDATLERLRREAALAIVPSRSAETFGMAAAEAMAAGLPVVASRVGALPELVEEEALVEPGDPVALARTIERFWGDATAGDRGRARVAALCAPDTVADALRRIYAD